MSAKGSEFVGGSQSVIFSAPQPGDVYWGEVVKFTVTLSALTNKIKATDYVQFALDLPGQDEVGVRVVDPKLASGRVIVDQRFVSTNAGTIELEVYIFGVDGGSVNLGATFFQEGVAPVPIDKINGITINQATPGRDYYSDNRLLLTNTSITAPSNSPAPINYFKVNYVPMDRDERPIIGKQFVANLRLTSGTVDASGVSNIEGALNNLYIYTGAAKSRLTIDSAGADYPDAGTVQLVKSDPSGKFDLYICAGSKLLAGDVRFDMPGNSNSNGVLIVTDMAKADPNIDGPELTRSVVDVSEEAAVMGGIPYRKSYTDGTQFYLIVSYLNASQSKVINYALTKIFVDKTSWNNNDRYFYLPVDLLNAPTIPGDASAGLLSHVSYITMSGGGEMNQSSSTGIFAMRSASTTQPVTPPPGNQAIPAPIFMDTTIDYPHRVTPKMCSPELRLKLDWTVSNVVPKAGNVYLTLSGWDVDSGVFKPATPVTYPFNAPSPTDLANKFMIVTVPASETKGYAANPKNGALGDITATYYEASLPIKTTTSLPVSAKFYSSGLSDSR